MFILSLKGIPQLTCSMPAKRQGSISNSSARRKNIRVDCYEIRILYLIWTGRRGRRIMCMVATIALCLSKGNKEFKEKNKEEFFSSCHFFPPCDYDVGKVVLSWKAPLQQSALSAKFQSFDRWLMRAELWLKELTDGFYFQKGWNRFMEITQ